MLPACRLTQTSISAATSAGNVLSPTMPDKLAPGLEALVPISKCANAFQNA